MVKHGTYMVCMVETIGLSAGAQFEQLCSQALGLRWFPFALAQQRKLCWCWLVWCGSKSQWHWGFRLRYASLKQGHSTELGWRSTGTVVYLVGAAFAMRGRGR